MFMHMFTMIFTQGNIYWILKKKKLQTGKISTLQLIKVDLEKVREEWESSGAIFEDTYKAAELYGIYEDLYRCLYLRNSKT